MIPNEILNNIIDTNKTWDDPYRFVAHNMNIRFEPKSLERCIKRICAQSYYEDEDYININKLIDEMGAIDPRKTRIVELNRYFDECLFRHENITTTDDLCDNTDCVKNDVPKYELSDLINDIDNGGNSY